MTRKGINLDELLQLKYPERSEYFKDFGKEEKRRRLTEEERAGAIKFIKAKKRPDGATPTAPRVDWSMGPDHPRILEGATVTPSELRRLARYARYRQSEKGRARMERYNWSPAGQAANWREERKRRQVRIADIRQQIVALEDEIEREFPDLADVLRTPRTKARRKLDW